jgi:hypothetical protein
VEDVLLAPKVGLIHTTSHQIRSNNFKGERHLLQSRVKAQPSIWRIFDSLNFYLPKKPTFGRMIVTTTIVTSAGGRRRVEGEEHDNKGGIGGAF